jgi:RNA polymerase sigma-70 factor, ECF subfamily
MEVFSMAGASRGAEGSTVSVLGTTEERRLIFENSMRNDGKALAQLAFCLCGHRATAEDLTAEAFARTWGRWQAGKIEDLLPYLRRTLVNLCRKSWRRERVARRHQSRFASPLFEEPKYGDLELVDAVLRLPSPQRAVIVLRYFEDLSEQVTAQFLGISPGTVKSRTSRALASLRSAYGETHDV